MEDPQCFRNCSNLPGANRALHEISINRGQSTLRFRSRTIASHFQLTSDSGGLVKALSRSSSVETTSIRVFNKRVSLTDETAARFVWLAEAISGSFHFSENENCDGARK